MARGFGSTLGAGTTDKVTSAFTGAATGSRSWFIRFNRNGGGGAGFGRLFDCGPNTEGLFNDDTNTTFDLNRVFSDITMSWRFTTPAAGDHSLLVTYDCSSNANDALAYLDGSSISFPLITSRSSGTASTSSAAYVIGNRSDNIRGWDGVLSEFAIWDGVLLTAEEAAALGDGVSPLRIRPSALVEYVPMLRANVSRTLAAPSLVGTAVQPHQRIIMPRRRTTIGVPAAVVGGGLSIPVAMHHYKQMAG